MTTVVCSQHCVNWHLPCLLSIYTCKSSKQAFACRARLFGLNWKKWVLSNQNFLALSQPLCVVPLEASVFVLQYYEWLVFLYNSCDLCQDLVNPQNFSCEMSATEMYCILIVVLKDCCGQLLDFLATSHRCYVMPFSPIQLISFRLQLAVYFIWLV